MRRCLGLVVALGSAGMAPAQFGRGGDWTTAGNDAQRSGWVRTDPKISPESMQKPGFQFLWKLKLNNTPRQSNSLTEPVLMDRYIGFRGFRSLGFVGGSSNRVFAIDTDLARLEWQIQFPLGAAGNSPDCPGGLTSAVSRPTVASLAPPPSRFGGFGRGGPARSGVGEPGDGAVTLARVPPAPRPPAPAPGATPAPPAGGGGFARGPSLVYALSGDGMLRLMNVAHGQDGEPPVKFLPPNVNARGLIVVDDVAYAATAHGCGGAPNGVWALDLKSKQVASWKAAGGVAGSAGPAVGPDGTLYAATTEGELAALEPKTLKPKTSYNAGKTAFTSTPVLFEYKDKILVAATTADGRVYLLDSASLALLSKTDPNPKLADVAAGALASWLDAGGTRWVLAPGANAIVAWKVADRNGAPVLESGWVSRDLTSPLPPMVINGVVFVASGGSSPAVLYALDGRTGKELWNSGKTITSFARGGLSGGGSQLYLGTHDGTLYAFGFPMEH